jgi:hypothetical protein
VTPFDHSLKDEFLNEYYNMTVNLSKSSKNSTINMGLPPTLELDELQKVNERVRELSGLSPDYAPSFIAKDKIAFMSSDEIRKVNKGVGIDLIFYLNDGMWKLTRPQITL